MRYKHAICKKEDSGDNKKEWALILKVPKKKNTIAVLVKIVDKNHYKVLRENQPKENTEDEVEWEKE